jgi:hypothetical protein
VIWKPWSPNGFLDLSFSGNVMLQASGNIQIGVLKNLVAVGIAVDASIVVNSDPRGNGNVGDNAQDFQVLFKVKGGPIVSMLDGALSIDLRKWASITGLLHAEWWDINNFVFAIQLLVDLSPGDFFKGIPMVPSIVGDVINSVMPFRLRTVDFYIDQSDWGVRIILVKGTVDNSPLKFLDDIDVIPGVNLYTDVVRHIPFLPVNNFKGGFGLSGKMSGNGMPVMVTFYNAEDKVPFSCITSPTSRSSVYIEILIWARS